MIDKYVLNDQGEPVLETDPLRWGERFARSRKQRIVKQETIGGLFVSTVFLGLDHQHGKGPPILWETMVFDNKTTTDMDRCYGNRQNALAMHQRMVEKARKT